jgi:hypothetical protein
MLHVLGFFSHHLNENQVVGVHSISWIEFVVRKMSHFEIQVKRKGSKM